MTVFELDDAEARCRFDLAIEAKDTHEAMRLLVRIVAEPVVRLVDWLGRHLPADHPSLGNHLGVTSPVPSGRAVRLLPR